MTKKEKPPKRVVLDFTISPNQGFAAMAASLDPPEGYVFHTMIRKGAKAKITYVLEEKS
jgi:hypothetical protein